MRQVYGFLRRTVGRHPDRAMAAIVLFLVLGLAWPWLSSAPVRAADSAVDDLVVCSQIVAGVVGT